MRNRREFAVFQRVWVSCTLFFWAHIRHSVPSPSPRFAQTRFSYGSIVWFFRPHPVVVQYLRRRYDLVTNSRFVLMYFSDRCRFLSGKIIWETSSNPYVFYQKAWSPLCFRHHGSVLEKSKADLEKVWMDITWPFRISDLVEWADFIENYYNMNPISYLSTCFSHVWVEANRNRGIVRSGFYLLEKSGAVLGWHRWAN